MANGSLTTTAHNEPAIREALVRANVVDCIIALPKQLFFSTHIPVCLWFLDRSKSSRGPGGKGEVLFIDARRMGVNISRTQKELADADVSRMAGVYHAWRGQASTEP